MSGGAASNGDGFGAVCYNRVMRLIIFLAHVFVVASGTAAWMFFSWAGWQFAWGFTVGGLFMYIWARLETGRWLGG